MPLLPDSEHTPASRIPSGFQFRVPWLSTDEPMHEELYREMPPQHQLHGIAARAVACRQDNDDVLFELFGSEAPAEFAVVHLTWSERTEQSPAFPWIQLYPTFSQWVADCMTPDGDDWDLDGPNH